MEYDLQSVPLTENFYLTTYKLETQWCMLSFVNAHVCLIKECLRTQPVCKLLNEMESWRNGHNTNIILIRTHTFNCWNKLTCLRFKNSCTLYNV